MSTSSTASPILGSPRLRTPVRRGSSASVEDPLELGQNLRDALSSLPPLPRASDIEDGLASASPRQATTQLHDARLPTLKPLGHHWGIPLHLPLPSSSRASKSDKIAVGGYLDDEDVEAADWLSRAGSALLPILLAVILLVALCTAAGDMARSSKAGGHVLGWGKGIDGQSRWSIKRVEDLYADVLAGQDVQQDAATETYIYQETVYPTGSDEDFAHQGWGRRSKKRVY